MKKILKINFLVCLVFAIFMVFDVNAAKVQSYGCRDTIRVTQKFINLANVPGATLNNTGISMLYYTSTTAPKQRVIYCLEKGVPIDVDGSKPAVSWVKQNIDSGTQKWLARIIAYGYPELLEGHAIKGCQNKRVATQLLVQLVTNQGANGAWKTYTKSDYLTMIATSSDATKRTNVATAMYNIVQNALASDTKPSFAGKTVTLKYNPSTYKWTGSITDTNKTVGNWTKSDSGNVTSTVSGNTVTLIASKDSAMSGKVTFTRTIPNGVLYYSDYAAKYQKTAYYVSGTAKNISVNLNYTLNEIGKGTVKIHKIDKYTGKNMKNAKFGIFDDNKCSVKAKDYLGNTLSEKTTDENGIVSWNNLYYPLEEGGKQTYYVKETATLNGYLIDAEHLKTLGADENGCIPVTVEAQKVSSDQSETVKYNAADSKVVTVYNIPYGNITILKQDSETGEVIEGVEFKLLQNNKSKDPAVDINGKEVANAITGKNGIAEFENIPYGDYILEEVKANDSYKVLKDPIEFTLDANTDALKFRDQGTEALPVVDSKDAFTYYLGDPTGDKKIDAEDQKILEQVIAKEDEKITTAQKYAVDVNSDGVVNQTDLDLMKKYIAGDTSVFEGLKQIKVEGEVLIPFETYKLGDPTDDGVIDSNDLTIIVGILEGTIKEEDITDVYKYASDVDLDGSITEKDKELMVAYLAGQTDAFEGLKEIEYPGQFQKRVTIVVTNVPIDMKVSKQAITNEKELKGATIVIENSKGEVFIKYKSTGKPYEFYIPVGEYKLIEEIAPNGYQNLKTEVEFKVGTDGNIELLSAKSNMYKLVKSKEENDNDLDHLIIYNNLKRVAVPNTGSTIAFLSIIGGAALIGGGGYAMYRRYKAS